MANPSKKKGTAAETRVRKYFESRGLRCERKALAGATDQGDLCLHLPNGMEVTIEVKAGKQTWHYSRHDLDEWKRQTLVEAINSGCMSVLIIVRYHRDFVDAEVWMPNLVRESERIKSWTMIYIDEFVDTILED